MKVLTPVSLILLLLSVRSTFGQFKIHHTTYGSPLGVPGHGSNTYLSPFGANSLSSVLTALGIGPSSPTNQLTLTPAATTKNPAVPTFVISNASTRNQRPTSQTFSQAINSRNPAANGHTVLRTSPTDPAAGGPQQIPTEPAVSNQIISNPTGTATSNTLSSRFAPPPPSNANTLNSNQGTQPNAALEPQSVNLLNSLFNNLLSPNPATPFSSLSSQTPFIIILPQQGAGPNAGPQPAQVIMNVDPSRSLQGNVAQPGTSSDIRANNVISNVAQFMQANGLSTDLLRGTGSQGSGTPQIITVTPQVANQGISSFPQETPVLVLVDPASLQGQSQSGTSALGGTTTGQSTLGNVGSRTSNQNVLNALTALAQPFPVTTSRPSTAHLSSSAPGTSGSGTAAANGLPPFPGQELAPAGSTANTAASGNPSTTGTASTALPGSAPNPSQVGVASSASTPGSSPRKTTKMIIPVIQDIRSLSRGAGGIYMYSFSIAGSDGITRHEVGEVAPGIRKISRTVSPAVIGSGTRVQGHAARNGGINGATSADVAANRVAGGANGLVDATGAGALADPVNVFGNYSYVDPNGQVFKLHYTHGPPSFMPQPPPEPLPLAAPHPFDFLLNKLTDLRVHHQLETVPGAAGTGATATGATGSGATGIGSTGTGTTGTGATETGATGTGATGTGATGTEATGTGATGTRAIGNGATVIGAQANGAPGNGATGSGATGASTTGNGVTGTGTIGNGATGTGTTGNGATSAGGNSAASVNGGGSTAANEVAPNEVGPGSAASSGTAGTNEILNAVDGPAGAGAEAAPAAGAEAAPAAGAEVAPAAGAEPSVAEAAPNAA